MKSQAQKVQKVQIVFFELLALGLLAGLPAQAQAQGQPCQWNYSFDANNNAVATYCGNVVINGSLVGGGGGTSLIQFTADGVTASFPLGVAVPSPSLVTVYLDGLSQINGVNFAITTGNNLTFGDPPIFGLTIVANVPH